MCNQIKSNQIKSNFIYTMHYIPGGNTMRFIEGNWGGVTVVFGIMVCTTLNMDHSKLRTELSQEIRKKIIDKHVNGKGYKTISKQLDIPVTTVAHIIQKFKGQGTVANLPGRGCKRKIDDKLKRRRIRIVPKEPRTTSNEIRGELQGQGTAVSDHTIRRCLSQSRPTRTPL